MINVNNIAVSKNDKTLAKVVHWDTASPHYFTAAADNKKIPTNAKGFRLYYIDRDTIKQANDGSIYILWHKKWYEEDGSLWDTWGITPITSADDLVSRMNHSYTLDNWGNLYATISFYRNGKKQNVGGLNSDDNTAQLTKIVNGWLNNGAKLFDDGAVGIRLYAPEKRAYKS